MKIIMPTVWTKQSYICPEHVDRAEFGKPSMRAIAKILFNQEYKAS